MTDGISNKGSNNLIEIAADVKRSGSFQINITGDNNVLRIGSGTKLLTGMIEMTKNNSKINIGKNCVLNGMFRCQADDSELQVGDGTTTMNVKILFHEKGRIHVGSDCMFSGDIVMDVSDMHSVIDLATNKRTNPPRDIDIGDHVWIANGVFVLKGVNIGEHSIIGARAVVCNDIPPHSIAVGVPARVIRDNITWDRARLPY